MKYLIVMFGTGCTAILSRHLPTIDWVTIQALSGLVFGLLTWKMD